jgi:phage terminase large subunit-like protein
MDIRQLSAAQILAMLPEAERTRELARLSDDVRANLRTNWGHWSRPAQRPPPGEWLTWLILAGRGFGKTRTGAEWVRENVCGATPEAPGRYRNIALVAETAADARDVMIEHGSGILGVHPPEYMPNYEPSKRRITWKNGATATVFNATEPDQLRGPEHDLAWGDELAKWAYARETYDQLMFGLRQGNPPRLCITTTPRPIPLLREILADEGTQVTKGLTLDNRDNLAPSFLRHIMRKYEGTRLGRQELNAELLDDVPGALWTRQVLDDSRVKKDNLPDMARIVVGVDPSGTSGDEDEGADIGIVVAGRGVNGRGYVLGDYTCKLSPDGWGRRAVTAYHQHEADRIVAEVNYGGAMVKQVIKTCDATVAYKEVVASRGKVARAEPIAAMFEQGRISIVGGFAELEDECVLMTSQGYVGEGSPNRVDAMVWALSELMLTHILPNAANDGPITIPGLANAFNRAHPVG